MIDTENAIIVDVEATTAIRQAEVLAAKRMLERARDRFELCPKRLLGDSAYGSAEMLGWLVEQNGIEPHVTVIEKSARSDGTFSREEFAYDAERDIYICPGGKPQRRIDYFSPEEGPLFEMGVICGVGHLLLGNMQHINFVLNCPKNNNCVLNAGFLTTKIPSENIRSGRAIRFLVGLGHQAVKNLFHKGEEDPANILQAFGCAKRCQKFRCPRIQKGTSRCEATCNLK